MFWRSRVSQDSTMAHIYHFLQSLTSVRSTGMRYTTNSLLPWVAKIFPHLYRLIHINISVLHLSVQSSDFLLDKAKQKTIKWNTFIIKATQVKVYWSQHYEIYEPNIQDIIMILFQCFFKIIIIFRQKILTRVPLAYDKLFVKRPHPKTNLLVWKNYNNNNNWRVLTWSLLEHFPGGSGGNLMSCSSSELSSVFFSNVARCTIKMQEYITTLDWFF